MNVRQFYFIPLLVWIALLISKEVLAVEIDPIIIDVSQISLSTKRTKTDFRHIGDLTNAPVSLNVDRVLKRYSSSLRPKNKKTKSVPPPTHSISLKNKIKDIKKKQGLKEQQKIKTIVDISLSLVRNEGNSLVRNFSLSELMNERDYRSDFGTGSVHFESEKNIYFGYPLKISLDNRLNIITPLTLKSRIDLKIPGRAFDKIESLYADKSHIIIYTGGNIDELNLVGQFSTVEGFDFAGRKIKNINDLNQLSKAYYLVFYDVDVGNNEIGFLNSLGKGRFPYFTHYQSIMYFDLSLPESWSTDIIPGRLVDTLSDSYEFIDSTKAVLYSDGKRVNTSHTQSKFSFESTSKNSVLSKDYLIEESEGRMSIFWGVYPEKNIHQKFQADILQKIFSDWKIHERYNCAIQLNSEDKKIAFIQAQNLTINGESPVTVVYVYNDSTLGLRPSNDVKKAIIYSEEVGTLLLQVQSTFGEISLVQSFCLPGALVVEQVSF